MAFLTLLHINAISASRSGSPVFLSLSSPLLAGVVLLDLKPTQVQHGLLPNCICKEGHGLKFPEGHGFQPAYDSLEAKTHTLKSQGAVTTLGPGLLIL